LQRGKLQAQPDVEVASFVVSGGRVLAASMDGETEAQGKVEGNREAAKAVVLTDVDGVIRQSLCVGTDCATTESFGFDTLRLKENNTRIAFADTSTGTFPAVNWQLVANDSASGGRNMFSFLDVTNSREIFTVEAAAPATSLYVDDSGRIGLRTSTPVLELHVSDGDTPGLRLEQNGSTGFTPQTWDVAGNEANFFVRDVTGGSRLSLPHPPGRADQFHRYREQRQRRHRQRLARRRAACRAHQSGGWRFVAAGVGRDQQRRIPAPQR
jgi:hypothetical protein